MFQMMNTRYQQIENVVKKNVISKHEWFSSDLDVSGLFDVVECSRPGLKVYAGQAARG